MSGLPNQPPLSDSSAENAASQPPRTRATRRGGRGRGGAGMTTDTRIPTQPGPFIPPSPSLPDPYRRQLHPSPTTLPPLTIPHQPTYARPSYPPPLPPPPSQQHPLYVPHQLGHHLPPLQETPATQLPPPPLQPRPPGPPIDRLRPLWTPPGSSSPYSSPQYAAQASPRTDSGPSTGQKRGLDPSYVDEFRTREPPFPSPGASEHRDPWPSHPSSHRGSSTSGTSAFPTLPLPIPSPSISTPEQSSSHRSSGQSSGSFPGPLQTLTPTSVARQNAIPATARDEQTQSAESRHQLYIRQQPVAARACGFGERDRRVIDPPPILQLLLNDYDPNNTSDVEELKSIYVVFCKLLSGRGDGTSSEPDVTIMTEPSMRPTRRLMGTLVASPFLAIDPEPDKAPTSHLALTASAPTQPQQSAFFLFPDLSCRTPGSFRLVFSLYRITPTLTSTPGERTACIAETTSDVFEVYSAKDFPGMQTSTRLTAGLKKAGAGVSLKKGAGGKGGGKGDDDTDDGGSGDDEGADPGEEHGKGKGKGKARGSRRGGRKA